MFEQMLEKIKNKKGFIAALDQSGGSTPKTLKAYGIDELQIPTDEGMFNLIHDMRTRVITSEAFNGERILGAILFEDTLNRQILGMPSAEYLWSVKNIIPFIKIDKGLEDVVNGCQKMKPIPELASLLLTSKEQGVFGTKMRSVIKRPNQDGIRELVEQQFNVAKTVLKHGMIPIIEPEVDIHADNKGLIELVLRETLSHYLNKLKHEQVILKLTLPETDNYYASLVNHPNVLKVVALSGGYARDEANKRLNNNNGMIASFSRALLCDLNITQSDNEMNESLDGVIDEIYKASIT